MTLKAIHNQINFRLWNRFRPIKTNYKFKILLADCGTICTEYKECNDIGVTQISSYLFGCVSVVIQNGGRCSIIKQIFGDVFFVVTGRDV